MKTVTEKALMDIVKELSGIRRGLEKRPEISSTKSYSGESYDTAIDISKADDLAYALKNAINSVYGMHKDYETAKTLFGGKLPPYLNDISELLAQMMLKNAMREELERAIEFSKVVMDANKKYGIELLREKYCNKEEK